SSVWARPPALPALGARSADLGDRLWACQPPWTNAEPSALWRPSLDSSSARSGATRAVARARPRLPNYVSVIATIPADHSPARLQPVAIPAVATAVSPAK